MDKYNLVQKRLVEQTEQAHYNGLRHRGLSGSICEALIVTKLRTFCPNYNFDRGMIKYCKPEYKGSDISVDNLSPQQDIIIYKGKPIYKIHEQAIIHISHVFGVIEVKKWAFPKMLKAGSHLIKNLENIKEAINKNSNRKMPVIFVTFRFYDRTNQHNNFFTNKKYLPIKHAYCFYGRGGYPWEDEDRWRNFNDKNKNIYSGQFNQLVAFINKLA